MALAAIPFRLTGRGPNTFVPQNLSQAPCHLRAAFFPGIGGFFAAGDASAKAAEFAAPAGPACSFVLWERVGWPKKANKIGAARTWPVLCVWLSERVFIWTNCVRASAASRSTSPASVQASQSKANSAPEHEASPFA